MPNTLLSDVWDETRAFLTREAALLAPVALMTFGVGALLFLFNIPEPTAGRLPEGGWLLWALPFAVLNLFGALAISMLTQRPGIAVRDALRQSGAALPRALGSALLLALGSALLLFVTTAVTIVFVQPLMLAAQNAVSIVWLVAVIVSARIALAFALLAEGRGSLTALAESWRLTRPVKWRLVLLMFGYSLVSALVLLLLQLAIGSVLLLVGRLLGLEVLGVRLTQVATTFVWSLLQMAGFVYAALLARRLATVAQPASKGT